MIELRHDNHADVGILSAMVDCVPAHKHVPDEDEYRRGQEADYLDHVSRLGRERDWQ